MAISKDQVFATCDRLFADGTGPSLVNIRSVLGEGSYSTIAKFLAEWKTASRNTALAASSEEETPEEISEMFSGPIASLWAHAVKLAAAAHVEQQDAMQLKLDDALKEVEEAFLNMDNLARRLDERNTSIHHLDATRLEVQGELALSSEQNIRCSSQLIMLQASYDRLLLAVGPNAVTDAMDIVEAVTNGQIKRAAPSKRKARNASLV